MKDFFGMIGTICHGITLLFGLVSLLLLINVFEGAVRGNPTGEPASVLFALALVAVPYCIGAAAERLANGAAARLVASAPPKS